MTRTGAITKAFNETVNAAHRLDLVPNSWVCQLRIGKARTVRGGRERGQAVIWMSTADRYHDARAFNQKIAESTWIKQSNWKTMQREFRRTGIPYHVEYAAINNDPEIGGFASEDDYLHLLASTCHEVAHAIQYTARGEAGKPHGGVWREIYRALRNELVNHRIGTPSATPAIPEKVAAEVAVSIKMPKPGTVTRRIFDVAEQMSTSTRQEVIEYLVSLGIKKGSASTGYSMWRKMKKELTS